jgi:hypothetical protein
MQLKSKYDLILYFRSLVDEDVTATYISTTKFSSSKPLTDPVKNLQNPLTHHGQNSLAMRNASIYHVGADSKPMSVVYFENFAM